MLYTIGDLHLSFEAGKTMDIFGEEWENHAEKLRKNFTVVKPDDVCVICGDLTWGMDLQGCLEDFRFIDALPGKKIILKGNHDFWWTTASKTKKFFDDNGIYTIDMLHNNCFFYKDLAICGTRGWVCTNNNSDEHDKKMMARECQRLELSLQAAGDTERKICFLHYPPLFGRLCATQLINVMKKYGVRECYYGHVHGYARLSAVEGEIAGITYRLISADHTGFCPVIVAE